MNWNLRSNSEGSLALTPSPVSREMRVRPARRRDLLAYFAGAFDLAEGREVGHAAVVAFVAHEVARALQLGSEGALRALDAGLLHASGDTLDIAAVASPGAANGWVAQQFGFDEATVEVLSAVHERWDGSGAPLGRSHADIPIESLCVAAAHWASDFADEVGHPLRARMLLRQAGSSGLTVRVGPTVAEALQLVLSDDATWLTVFGKDLPDMVARLGVADVRPSHVQVYSTAHAMGEVIDRAIREPGRALRVSILASEIAAEMGMPSAACDLIGVAGYLIDVGQLGVPRSIVAKPTILTVEEMELMRRHPGLGARLIELVPGFEEVSLWVEQHHERPDGRGYPGMLDSGELPLPPLILGASDAYWALRASRPYRPGHTADEALAIIQAPAGSQFDADVVLALESALPRAMEALDEIADAPLSVLRPV